RSRNSGQGSSSGIIFIMLQCRVRSAGDAVRNTGVRDGKSMLHVKPAPRASESRQNGGPSNASDPQAVGGDAVRDVLVFGDLEDAMEAVDHDLIQFLSNS